MILSNCSNFASFLLAPARLFLLIAAFVLTACGQGTSTAPLTPSEAPRLGAGMVVPSPTVTLSAPPPLQVTKTITPLPTTASPALQVPPTASPITPSLRAMVSIAPQAYVVERVGGDAVAVSVMIPPGSFPETYEPKPAQMIELSNTDVYFRIDLPFERSWMDRFRSANPNMRIVDMTQGITRISGIPHAHEHEHDGEDHAHQHEHEEGEEHPDPHIWLSPTLVKAQARTVADALIDLDPAHQATYEANLSRLLADIDALHQDITKNLAPLTNRKFLVFHPAWGYFARDYGLEMIPIEVGGQEPSAAELAAIIQKAKAEGITVVFAQPQMNPQSAQTIAKEIGGEVILIDPLAHDWLDNMRRVSDTFAKVLSRGTQ